MAAAGWHGCGCGGGDGGSVVAAMLRYLSLCRETATEEWSNLSPSFASYKNTRFLLAALLLRWQITS